MSTTFKTVVKALTVCESVPPCFHWQSLHFFYYKTLAFSFWLKLVYGVICMILIGTKVTIRKERIAVYCMIRPFIKPLNFIIFFSKLKTHVT